MNVDEIKARIKGNIGREIFFYDKAGSTNTIAMELAEEAFEAYKDVSRVVEICQQAGISHKVLMVEPLGVVKG